MFNKEHPVLTMFLHTFNIATVDVFIYPSDTGSVSHEVMFVLLKAER